MMTPMTQAERIIDALVETDPEFLDFVDQLYGVSKSSPDSSESHIARNLAIAGTTAGAVMGARDLITDVPKLGGKLIPAHYVSSGKAARKVGLAGTALGADVLATRELKKPQQRQPVGKLAIPSVADMAGGLRTKMKGITGRLIPAAAEAKPTAAPGSVPLPKKSPVTNTKAMNNAQQFTAGALQMGGTPAGKVLVGGGLVASALKAKHMMAGKQDPNQLAPQDPTVGKRRGVDIVWEGEFAKVDDEKQQVFGWASVVELNGLPVDDHQGDRITQTDLEDAAYHYVLNSRVGGQMHKRIGGKDWYGTDAPHQVSEMIESMVFTDEKVAKMGLPNSFPRGWWTGFQIHDPETWEDVKKGRLRSFSIHGKGKREDIPMDTAMGW